MYRRRNPLCRQLSQPLAAEQYVLQRDLGEHTAKLAGRMTSFNPDQTWKKVDVTLSER
jgi:Protein of unknown function (DUF2950)